MKKYSSNDFGRTENKIRTVVPEKLIHPQVDQTNLDGQFSEERKHPVHVVDLPSHNVSMTIGTLLPSQKTNKHRHTYETLIYILEGEGETTIEDRVIAWKAGDALYIPVWAWHFHRNLSNQNHCKYVAAENMPMLANIAGLAIREEEELSA